MLTKVHMPSNWTIEVDEDHSLVDIERAEPFFFKKKHGARETFTIYRGCLIVRNTVTFSGQKPRRYTAVYLFGMSSESKKKLTFCVSSGFNINSIRQGKMLIESILTEAAYNRPTDSLQPK